MKGVTISLGNEWWCFPDAQIDTGSWEGEWRSDGRMLLRDDAGKLVEGIEVDEPEDISEVLATPTPEERRLREVNLARLMLVIVDIVLAGDPLGLETARDLLREVRHTYPALVGDAMVGF